MLTVKTWWSVLLVSSTCPARHTRSQFLYSENSVLERTADFSSWEYETVTQVRFLSTDHEVLSLDLLSNFKE